MIMDKLKFCFGLFIVGGILLFLVLLCIEKEEQARWTECGIVINMKDGFDVVEHYHHKRSTTASLENKLVLVINYSGDFRTEEVSENLYYRKHIGDPICFTRHPEGWGFAVFMSGVSFVVIAVMFFWNFIKLFF
jgi:hypothetical protein